MHVLVLIALLLFGASPASAADLNQSSWSQIDANNNAAPPAGWPAGMAPNQVEPTARAMMGATKRWYDRANATATSGGGANAQTLTYTVAPTALVTGDVYRFIAGFTNAGPTTMNINGLGAKAVQSSSGAPLIGGEINAGSIAEIVYDGTQFKLFPTASNGVPWAAAIHQNAGGTSYGHNLVWADQNLDLTADHFTIQSTDPSLITYAAPSGTYVAGEKPGISWKIGGTTYAIKALVHAGDTNFTFATRLGICLGHSPNSDCDISPSSPTITDALAALSPKATISGPGDTSPAPQSVTDVRVPFDVPFDLTAATTCPTAINSAATTITVTGCTMLDNGPGMETARYVAGHSAAGDQLGPWRALGAASSASSGVDTFYAALYPFVLSPNATNPTGELQIATASSTSGRSASPQIYLGNGVVFATAAGANCGYTGRGTLRQCGPMAIDGHMAILAPIPAITSGFGTSPSIIGADNAARITVGTGGASSGVVTFNTVWQAAPACVANNETTSQLIRATAITTTLTLTGTMTAGDKITFICMGYQ